MADQWNATSFCTNNNLYTIDILNKWNEMKIENQNNNNTAAAATNVHGMVYAMIATRAEGYDTGAAVCVCVSGKSAVIIE